MCPTAAASRFVAHACALSLLLAAAFLAATSRASGAETHADTARPPVGPWHGPPLRGFVTALLPVAGGGDVNHDGYADVAIAGPLENGARGRVEVYLGGPGGLGAEPAWIFVGEDPGHRVGMSLALADVNGDGLGDVLATDWVGVMERPDPGDESSVWVFLGSDQNLPARPSQRLRRQAGQVMLKETLASAGDVNGDGCADVAVVAIDPSQALDGGRCLAVFHGSREGLHPEPATVLHSEQTDSNFGATFAAAEDVNGDHYGDLLVGAPRFRGRFPEGGKVYLFLGSKDGLISKPAWTTEYPLAFDPHVDGGGALLFGWGVGAAGDVNRDGFGDVLVGAWNGSHGDPEEGLAFLYLGSKRGPGAQPAWHVEGNQSHVHLGGAVRGVGDLNGDGFDDVAVGTPLASHGQKDEGVVAVFHGSRAGLAADPAWTFDSDRSNGHLGEFTGPAGDVNGDGVLDVLVAGMEPSGGDPFLRTVVVYGQPDGRVFSSEWSWRKSWATTLEQWWGRLPRGVVWTGTTAGIALLAGGLLGVHFKLRRELVRVIAENRRLAAMQERSRIARDMHDHLGADLTRLAAQLDRGTNNYHTLIPLTEWRDSAQHAVKTLDELVWATNPAQDTLEGLANYLAEFGPSFLNAHGLACDLDVPSQLPAIVLPSRARHNLFLIAKEALRNVVQHAGATRVRLALTHAPHTLGLIIEDNGQGGATPPNERGPLGHTHHGNGLRNMQVRARELGGTLRVESISMGGTRVAIDVRLKTASQDLTPMP